MRTLLIDNYDSFTFNLFHLLGEVNGDEPIVVRNDELPWEELAALPVDNVVISPGPGRPEHERDVGVSLEVLRRAKVPVLGVCLGHQALAHLTGGAIDHAPEVMHGRLSPIHHDGRGLFAGIPQGFAVVRYHSLVVGALPAELRVTAWTPDAVVMGLEHRTRPLWGVQFHPESISTEHGRTLVRNFRDLTRACQRRAVRAPRPASRPPAGTRVHHRSLETWCDPEAAFVELYGDRDHAVWLDSSRAERGLARFSFMGAPEGPLGQVVRYDVATRTLTIDGASGREELRESVLDYCERELARLRAEAPELPFDFTCGFAGYLGYELKAECGGALVHRSPLPDAALVPCDRVVAFDHRERRVHLVALADAAGAGAAEAWLAATERELEAIARRPPPAAPPAARAARPTWPTSRPASTRSSRARATRSASPHSCTATAPSIRSRPTASCARATPRRTPRCCASARCRCSARRRSASCASTASGRSSPSRSRAPPRVPRTRPRTPTVGPRCAPTRSPAPRTS
jgi:para-aminobenzoate synthetase